MYVESIISLQLYENEVKPAIIQIKIANPASEYERTFEYMALPYHVYHSSVQVFSHELLGPIYFYCYQIHMVRCHYFHLFFIAWFWSTRLRNM